MLFLYRMVAKRIIRRRFSGNPDEATDMARKKSLSSGDDQIMDNANEQTQAEAVAAEAASTDAPGFAADAPKSRLERAETMVKDHMLVSIGVGVLPFPLLDIAAGLASQVMLVKRLCGVYEVPFKESTARAVVMSLAGSLSSTGIALVAGLSVAKFIPGAGTAAGLIALPVANAAMTYAIGKVFIGHFEMGGTLVDFSPKSNGAYFRDLYARGKACATDLFKRKPKSAEEVVIDAEPAPQPQAA
jgi:uncharacterized protein (DUF697 family)